MKVLFIGGSGLISTAVSKLAIKNNVDLYLLNRGNHNDSLPSEVKFIKGDINNVKQIREAIKDYQFDVVVDWIAYNVDQVERDYSLFKGKTKQYIFISSASAYIKPIPTYPITEKTPLGNKYWEYSENKKRCEEYLMSVNSKDFNVTIIRPSHTYNDQKIIAAIKSWGHPYTLIDRILKGKKIIVPGNGKSLWTLTYNEDFAEAFVEVLGNKKTYGESYHITSDFVYTWDHIHNLLYKALDVRPNIVHIPSDFIIKHAPELEGELFGDKDWSLIFDNDKIKQIAPDYKAKTKYEDTVKTAVNRLLTNRDLQTVDEEFNQLMDHIINEYERNN
ncbi:MAG: NAD-dependent epimerase/dehydratase family protein [Firmicutes bacterium]|nr:NAD-dependent epimerase/dehydratase family protein [Bacillota bacterium]